VWLHDWTAAPPFSPEGHAQLLQTLAQELRSAEDRRSAT
jgi:hypothetical protein